MTREPHIENLPPDLTTYLFTLLLFLLSLPPSRQLSTYDVIATIAMIRVSLMQPYSKTSPFTLSRGDWFLACLPRPGVEERHQRHSRSWLRTCERAFSFRTIDLSPQMNVWRLISSCSLEADGGLTQKVLGVGSNGK